MGRHAACSEDNMSSLGRVHGSRLFLLAFAALACGGQAAGEHDSGSGGQAAGEHDSGSGGQATGGHASGAGGGTAGVVGIGPCDASFGAGPRGNVLSCTTLQLEPPSGLIECLEGYRHRPTAVACEAMGDTFAQGGAPGQEGSPCLADEDCLPGTACICSGASSTGGECVPARCRVDADCPDGYLCASYHRACGQDGFTCQQADDDCVSDANCPATLSCTWEYVPASCVSSIALPKRVCRSLVCNRP